MSKKFKKLLVPEGYRHYWSKYPEGYTILEALLNWVDSVNQLTENVNDWNIYLDDFVETFDEKLAPTVRDMLNEMEQDGRLADIINEEIFETLNDRIDTHETRIDTLTDRVKETIVNIKDYGATGNGVDDDTQVFQQVANMGVSVYVPPGTYVLSNTVYMQSNTQFIGSGDDTVIKHTGSSRYVAFRGNGDIGDMINIVSPAGARDTHVSLTDVTELNEGDYIRIMSQRDAMHRDDSGEWWAGVKTSNNDTVYFAELKKITRIDGNDVHFDSALIYPSYHHNQTLETSDHSRAAATVDKMDFKTNILVSNMKFDGNFSSPVRFYQCAHSKAEDLKWINAQQGELLFMVRSYQCEGYRLSVEYRSDYTPPNYYARNSLKTASCFNCGFRECVVIGGSQSCDFTYMSGITNVDMYSYIIDCEIIEPTRHGITSHGGSYNPLIQGNTITNAIQDGIMTRSPLAIIKDNLVIGSNRVGSIRDYGIRLNQGASIDCVISDNIVDSFNTGIGTIDDGPSDNTHFEYMGTHIINNTITSVNIGIEFRSDDTPINRRAHVLIQNNKIKRFTGSSGIMINFWNYFRDFKIYNNTFIGNSNATRGISSVSNVFDLDIQNNTLMGVGVGLILGEATDPIFDSVHKRVTFKNNTTSFTQTSERLRTALNGIFPEREIFQNSLTPFENGNQNLGSSSFRWNNAYLTNQPSVASDIRLKNNVTELNQSLNIINALKPVSYHLKDTGDLNYGLIAQEVEQVLPEGVVTPPETDDEMYGMKYEALIPFLIKAVQELNDKIDSR